MADKLSKRVECPHCDGVYARRGLARHIAIKHKGEAPPVASRADQVAKREALEAVDATDDESRDSPPASDLEPPAASTRTKTGESLTSRLSKFWNTEL